MVRSGYVGKVLRVDLSNHRISDEIPDPQIIRNYIGGSGWGAKILFMGSDFESSLQASLSRYPPLCHCGDVCRKQRDRGRCDHALFWNVWPYLQKVWL